MTKKESVYRRKTCRGCGSESLELVFALKPSPIGDAYVPQEKIDEEQKQFPIDLFMCKDCGLAQLSDVIDPDVLYGDYIYVTSSSMGLSQHFDEYAGKVIDRVGLSEGDQVVDLGSNDGTLLGSFKRKGLKVLGVEPAGHIASIANESGIPTLSAYFNRGQACEIADRYGKADVITANNVFANIDDLDSWVQGVGLLLADNGVFVFESYYLADLVRNMVFDFIYHEHLTSFSVKPVKKIFERYGLELAAVERVDTKGGSLRYYVQRPGGPVPQDGSVAALLHEEDLMGLYEKETYDEYSDKINALREQLVAFLKRAKDEGKTIAGFGASITCTTLIYHFGIGGYLDYLVDDNPAKQELYSPGHHIPVYPSRAIYERKPDIVLLLAWRFGDQFMREHQAYLDNGGFFIRPVPRFEIIQSKF